AIGARNIFAMHAGAVAHGIDFAAGERANGMKVVAPGPAILLIDGNPEMPVDWVIAARRDHSETRHHPGSNAPIVIAVLGIAAGADVKAAGLFDDFEIGLHVGEI